MLGQSLAEESDSTITSRYLKAHLHEPRKALDFLSVDTIKSADSGSDIYHGSKWSVSFPHLIIITDILKTQLIEKHDYRCIVTLREFPQDYAIRHYAYCQWDARLYSEEWGNRETSPHSRASSYCSRWPVRTVSLRLPPG